VSAGGLGAEEIEGKGLGSEGAEGNRKGRRTFANVLGTSAGRKFLRSEKTRTEKAASIDRVSTLRS
jgi:hypothetical protein